MNLFDELVCGTKTALFNRVVSSLFICAVFAAGCASVQKDVTRFEPVPREEIGAVELEPVVPEGGGRLQLGRAHSECYSDLDIPHPLPQPVQDEIAELQNSYPRTFQRGLDRSSRYMPYLKAEFRKAGLPEDLAWLAMVESMFQPKVVSPAGAGGMWQFMRATGRRYNLRMDSYVDERYNWHSATRAAIEYLKHLHDFFDGDWALAITAYNMGEGGLARAIGANDGERDFFALINSPPASNRMKRESKKYYPRLLAYIIVAQNLEEYGFEPVPEPFEDVLRIPVKGMYYLADIDRALGLSRGTLASLNPDLLREATPPQGEYPVAVPREKHAQFLAALKTVKSVQYAGVHRVKRGETISQIARRYGVSEKELMRINNVRSPRSLQINQVLQLPGTAIAQGGGAASVEKASAANTSGTTTESPATNQGATARIYTVKRGDTLYDIAKAHNVKVADLQRWNNLGGRSKIKVGQALTIGAETATAANAPILQHTVKPGEYPGIIAQLYGVSVSDLLRWNNLDKRSVIRVGDKLVVAGEAAASPGATIQEASAQEKTDAPAVIKHKVASGDTAGAIASRYGVKTKDLLAWNSLTAKSILRVGQYLTVRNPTRGTGRRDQGNDVQMAQSQADNRVVHKVTAGQNPTTIARQYGVRVSDLFKWNNWKDKHILRIGDEVEIYHD